MAGVVMKRQEEKPCHRKRKFIGFMGRGQRGGKGRDPGRGNVGVGRGVVKFQSNCVPHGQEGTGTAGTKRGGRPGKEGFPTWMGCPYFFRELWAEGENGFLGKGGEGGDGKKSQKDKEGCFLPYRDRREGSRFGENDKRKEGKKKKKKKRWAGIQKTKQPENDLRKATSVQKVRARGGKREKRKGMEAFCWGQGSHPGTRQGR